jgi:hypothetical protein
MWYLLLFHGKNCLANAPQYYVYTCIACPVSITFIHPCLDISSLHDGIHLTRNISHRPSVFLILHFQKNCVMLAHYNITRSFFKLTYLLRIKQKKLTRNAYVLCLKKSTEVVCIKMCLWPVTILMMDGSPRGGYVASKTHLGNSQQPFVPILWFPSSARQKISIISRRQKGMAKCLVVHHMTYDTNGGVILRIRPQSKWHE